MRQALASRRLFARLMLCALTLTAFPAFDSAARQQSASGTPFTVEDLLEVRSLNDGELSDDGRWLAIQTASLRDRIGIDNYRFGDPTYISPTRAEVLIIDTQAGRA